MKKTIIKIFAFLVACWALWVLVKFSSQAFAQRDGFDITTIVNTGCIEYTTPDWTWVQCDDAEIYYADENYSVKKRQKVWNMAYTDEIIDVELGGTITYKVEFANIWPRNGLKWQVQDYLPNCILYNTSSIHWVDWASFVHNSNNTVVWYRWFTLNAGQSWYMIVTGQVKNTTECQNVCEYLNTWWFKLISPVWSELYSTVVARREWCWWWGWSWSDVEFTKTWNKSVMHPGEGWLTFTLRVVNHWPNTISNISIQDIWPNDDCIKYDWYSWVNLQRSGTSYIWLYNGTLSSWGTITLQLFAHVKDSAACVWPYINTWKLTYVESWNKHTLYDKYSFKVVDDGPDYDVHIRKKVNKSYVTHWETIRYTIEYRNEWTKPLVNYTIKDEWPGEIHFDESNPEVTRSNWNIYEWDFVWPLNPGVVGTIVITGTVY